MSAGGSINLAGVLTIAQSVGQGVPFPLSEAIGQVEVKTFDLTLPPSSGSVTIPMPFSPTVTEALFFAVLSPAIITLDMTSSDTAHPGPARFGGLGLVCMHTFSPGEGLVAAAAINSDPINEVQITVVLATAPNSSTVPPYWTNGNS